LIKKNLIYEKPKIYSKIQLHNKEINNKANNATIAPERYHSSKLLSEVNLGEKVPKDKLFPTPKETMPMRTMAAPKDLQISQTLVVERKEKNDLLS
jgi:hypothetical protein